MTRKHFAFCAKSYIYEVSAALTEKLRGRELTGYEADFAAVKECYEKTVAAIKAFEESN